MQRELGVIISVGGKRGRVAVVAAAPLSARAVELVLELALELRRSVKAACLPADSRSCCKCARPASRPSRPKAAAAAPSGRA